MAWLGMVFSIVGVGASIASGSSETAYIKEEGDRAYDEGLAAEREREFEARQHDYFGTQAKAAAQRRAHEERRVARFMESRAIAVAAAGGGSVDDPTVTKIIGDIYEEGEYRALTAMYEGGQQAREHQIEAVLLRYEGAMAKRAGQVALQASKYQAKSAKLGMFGNAASGASSIATRYADTSSRQGTNWRGTSGPSRYGYQ